MLPKKDLNGTHKYPVSLMLDSGAFSAWTREKTIDLGEYIECVKEHEHLLWHYVNLDVIPGRLNVQRTAAQIRESAEQSYKNLGIMKRAGLKPMPVFHQGEDFAWLHRMVDEGEFYIGISPSDDEPRPKQVAWMDQCFTHLTDRDGWPLVRTHGFGVLNPQLLRRYPWYSVDGTTWALSAGYGWTLMATPRPDGTWDFMNPERVALTHEHRAQGGNHMKFTNMSKSYQANVRRYFAEVCGCDMRELHYASDLRRKAFLQFYMGFCEQLQPVQFRNQASSLITRFKLKDMKPIKNMRVTPIMATFPDKTRSRTLNEMNVRFRLLSFYHMREEKEGAIEEYVRTGGPTGTAALARRPAPNWGPAHLSYRSMHSLQLLRDYDAREKGTAGET